MPFTPVLWKMFPRGSHEPVDHRPATNRGEDGRKDGFGANE